MKIGIPQSLTTYIFGHIWKKFFSNLGLTVVSSRTTNRSSLEAGIKLMPGEACLPLKCYAGHVLELIARGVDYVFIPRIVCLQKKPSIKLACPKFIGLPDMFRALCPDCTILTCVYDLRVEQESQSLLRMAQTLGFTKKQAIEAYRGIFRDVSAAREDLREDTRPLIAVVGHEYLIKDPYLNFDIAEKLRTLGCNVWCCTDLTDEELENEIGSLRPVSWFYEQKILGAVSRFLKEPKVAGIIFLVSFGCGSGSIAGEILDYEIRPGFTTPILRIIIDEHTGETGLMTRLESFIDMISEKRR